MKKVEKKFGGLKNSPYLCIAIERQTHSNVPVAQLVEQLTLNQRVQGSSPCGDTTDNSPDC